MFGTFPWQMQPYCNVVTLTLTTIPAGFTLDGSDNQCGASTKGSATGIGVFNLDGSVGLNFTIVTSPGAKGVQVSAIVSPANGQGAWTDSVGNSGTFALFGNAPGLPVRPLPASGIGPAVITTTEIAAGAVGGTDINTAEVQARVSGVCASGQYVRGINANGTVVCEDLQTVNTGQVVIGSYAPGENVTNSNSERAFILVNLGGSNQQIPYYAERAVTVQAGVTYTYALKANQSAGSSVSQSCSGTYAVTLHAGTLP